MFDEHADRGDVDERDRFGVEDDGPDARVAWRGPGSTRRRPRRWRRRGRPRPARSTTPGLVVVLGVPVEVGVLVGRPGDLAELATCGCDARYSEQQQRDGDADEQPGQRVEDQDTEHRRHRGDEVGTRRDAVDLPEPARREAVEPHERGEVDELDQRRDHDRAQRRLGEILEQTGEEQQRDDGSDGGDEPRQLRARARRRVHRGLREAARSRPCPGTAPTPMLAAPRPMSSRLGSIS